MVVVVVVASLHVVVAEAYLEAALTFVVVVALHLGGVVVVPLPSQAEAPYP